jgi:hypothetical protein
MKSNFKNESGNRFHRLLVIELSKQVHSKTSRAAFYLCKCDCGNEKIISINSLRSGKTKSCGCLHIEAIKNAKHSITHGKSYVSEYSIWSDMKKRCFNKKSTHFNHYGGRGITVCEHWLVFENFYKDMGPRPSKKHSLDRVDNNGNYQPNNCRWATKREQNLNKRHKIGISGLRGIRPANSRKNPFQAYYFVNGKSVYIGNFKTKEEAIFNQQKMQNQN